MLKMVNWRVSAEVALDRCLGFIGEHRARWISIRARVPGYACKLDLEFEDGRKNILDLTAEGGVLCAELRREHVSCPGRVLAQVRGIKGETVMKSNVFELRVRDSVGAEDAFEPLAPGEFEQIERRVTEIAERAGALAARTPQVRGGTWWVYDMASGEYRNTGEPSSGTPGPMGEKGDKGDALTFDMLTGAQKEALTDPPGKQGEQGRRGNRGNAASRATRGIKATPRTVCPRPR